MSSLKIWHLLSNPWSSAITQYALASARALETSTLQNFFTPLKGSSADKKAESLGLQNFPVSSFSPSSYFSLYSLAKKIQPDLIFVYGGKETAFTRVLGHKKVIRFRGDARDLDIDPTSFSYRLSQGHLAGLLFPCEKIAKVFSNVPLPQKIVPLGLNEKKFKHFEEIFEKQRPEIHFIGRFDPVKGHQDFFELFSLMLSKWGQKEKPFLRVMGEEARLSKKDILRLAIKAGLVQGQNFEITPYRVNNIENILASSSLVVIPSLGSEVICRVAQEALMCGSRIFVSGAGALEEVLQQKDFGSSYAGSSKEDRAQQLAQEIRTSCTETASERKERSLLAKSLFSLDTMKQQLMSFVETFL